jgi:hypothetical protein
MSIRPVSLSSLTSSTILSSSQIMTPSTMTSTTSPTTILSMTSSMPSTTSPTTTSSMTSSMTSTPSQTTTSSMTSTEANSSATVQAATDPTAPQKSTGLSKSQLAMAIGLPCSLAMVAAFYMAYYMIRRRRARQHHRSPHTEPFSPTVDEKSVHQEVAIPEIDGSERSRFEMEAPVYGSQNIFELPGSP